MIDLVGWFYVGVDLVTVGLGCCLPGLCASGGLFCVEFVLGGYVCCCGLPVVFSFAWDWQYRFQLCV